jgi:GMP synthase (glutamine-hydrolysing)
MRVLIIENSPTAPAGLFGTWLADHGAAITTIGPTALPASPAGYDLIVTLGSPRGAYEDIPWIHAQRDFLARALEHHHPVIGICFGAQIIAEAIGGKAAPNTERHAGWIDITDTKDPVFAGPWVRWHGDHIALPPDAEILATSRNTIQAFSWRSAVAVQFHPEADEAILADWAAKTPHWLAENDLDADRLAAQSATLVPARAQARDALFRALLARAMAPSKQEQAA